VTPRSGTRRVPGNRGLRTRLPPSLIPAPPRQARRDPWVEDDALKKARLKEVEDGTSVNAVLREFLREY
jgi:hypothetical protein